MKQHLTFFLVLISILFVTSPVWADDPYLSQELTFRANETTTVYMTKNSNSPTVTTLANLFLQYSTDEGETWETFSASAAASKLTIEAGSTMRLRRNPDNGINTSGLGVNSTSLTDKRWYFVTTGDFSVEGNVMSLIDGENFATNTTIPAHCCFNCLFLNNTALTNIDKVRLPATTLKVNCYRAMFQGTGVTDISRLSLPEPETVASYSYNQMFKNCTSLTSLSGFRVPSNLGTYACLNMFQSCTGLTDLVGIDFAADTLNNYCYQLMFQACTGLTSVMDTFRVSVIATNSCDQMFLGCTNLRQTPAIKVDSIGTAGCINMFKTCGTTLTGTDSMTAGDIIVSKAIYYQGCQTMYAGSTRLKNAPAIKAGRIFGTTDKNGGCRYMFQDLTGISSAGAIKADIVDAYGCSYMYTGCTKLKRIPKIKVGTFGGTYPFQYMFTGCSSLDFNKDTLSNTGLTDYCYYYMFEKCTGITNTSELYLPADTIAPYAYNYMFTGCTGITDIWDSIQVSVIGNRACQGMFNGCTKLKHSSTLVVDSIGLLGCNAMFKACGTATATADSMTAGDIIVKKAIYNQGCQNMFNGSTKLKKTPNVYAERVMSGNKTATGGCYLMFNGLAKVPRMGKISINEVNSFGCEQIFPSCTTLVAVDTISIGTLGSYGLSYAFTGCTALPKMPTIKIDEFGGSYPMQYMFNGCSSLTLEKDTLFNKDLTDYCYYYMFQNCTSITDVSELHLAADTVAPYAYSYMFNGCAGITDMWDTLKISVIEDRACQNMFLSCTHIKHTPTLVVDSIGLLGCNVMFKNCGTATAAADSMTAGDIIVSKAIYNQGCQNMFNGSTKLKKTPNVYAERVMSGNKTATGGCYQMFNGLAKVPRMGKISINEVNSFGCEQMFPSCTTLSSVDTIRIGTLGSSGLSSAFTGCSALPKMPTIKVDELVGDRNMQYMFNGCTSLTFDNDTLFNKDLTNYCYLGMFTGCNGLTDIEGLHIAADTLAPYACNAMFSSCANLTSVKDTLRFKVIGSHSCDQMFTTCKKLDVSPVIFADSIGEAGCYRMFVNCSTNASVGLSAAGNIVVNGKISTLGLNEIFSGCNRLTTAPSVFAKRVGSNGATQTGGCYNMFNSLKITSADYLKIDTIDAFGCELMYNKCASLAAMDTIIMDSVGTQGCWKMFDGCTVLTQAPKIKAGVIGYRGLYQMYTGRTPFTSSDTIFVRLIGENGCEQMFNGCSGLTKLPYIAADSIGLAGCSNMFKSCTALDFDNDILPCSKLGPQAYSYIFNGCNGITDLSQLNLPVTRLEEDCYQFMFNSCLGLVDISTFVLPATEIAPGAYNNMFNACTNLTTAWPVFSPSIIGDYGCYHMFNGCIRLDPAPAITVDSIGPNGCQQMFINCYNSKTATGIHTAGDITVSGTVGAHGLNDIYSGCHYLTTTPNITAGRIMSNDAINTGGCYRMFNGLTGLTSAGYMRVGTIGSFGCQEMFQGCTNLLSMDSIRVDSVGTKGCYQMFKTNAKFAKSPKITADVIGEQGCLQFCNCTTLVSSDTIRARKVYQEGFREMFNGCTKLAASPYIAIDSVGESGCYRMFGGCWKDASNGILTADSLIIDKIGYAACESMFEGCKRLATINGIKNTKMYDYGCYNMFKTCTALVDISDLALSAPIMGAHCYDNMFSGCTALTTIMPRIEVSYIGEQSCYQMFNTCKKLTAAPAIIVDSIGVKGCQQMFKDCYNSTGPTGLVSAGDIVVNGKIAPLGLNDMYLGCQLLTTAPSVTAGSIESDGTVNTGGCYRMFNTLNGLTSAGYLRAGTIGDFGCQEMFFTCKLLTGMDSIVVDSIGTKGCYQMFLTNVKFAHAPKINAGVIGEQGCYQMLSGTTNAAVLTADTIRAREIHQEGLREMFSGCKKLSVSPYIISDTIGYLGCYRMFNGCYTDATVGLHKADSIIVNNAIGREGCEEMFLGCQRMDTARAILTPKIHEAGCMNMFQNCFVVSTTADGSRYSEGFGDSGTLLLGDSACHLMFNSCTRLDSCADLRFSTVGAHACDKMFLDCNGLDVSPAVTAAKVKDYGFYQMFNFATTNTGPAVAPVGFNNARDINIGEVGNRGCYQMFFQCRNLSAAPNLTINKVGDHGCYQMFLNSYSFKSPTYYGIASIGTFNINEIGSYGCQEMFSGCQRLEAAPAITAVSVGAHGCEKMFYNCWVNASVGLQTAGAITSNSVANYGYASIFEGCKRLTGVQNNEIRSGFAGDYAFTRMFYGCSALATAPALQVPELGKYACQYMFLGCTSVAAMPVLPAMKIDDYCYSHMFEGCTALATVNPLAVTMLPEGAYEYMFNGCTSLATAPAMAATTVKPNCYQFMFQECTSLTSAPTLPATKLAVNCYNSMFKGCTSLQTAPVLPATELETGCYTQMFNGCKALNYMKVNFTDWRFYGAATDPTYNWVASVTGAGNFYCPEGLDIIKDANHVPKNFINQLTTGNKLIFDANTGHWPDGTDEQVTINQSAIEDIPHATKLNCVFTRWNTEADGSGDDLNLGNLADEDITYYAQYQEIGVTLQKWLSNAIFLSITNLPATVVAANVQVVGGGSAKSCWLESSTADEGVYKLVFNKNDVRLHAGGVLDVTLTDEDEVPLGVFSVQIPFLISENTNSSSLGNTEGKEICVLSGATLTFNDNRICDNLVVCAGAKAVIPAGYTLNTNNIVLRGGDLNNGTYSYTSPQLVVNGSIVNTSGKVNYQYLTGLQQQYSLCLPADVHIADVTYPDGTPAIFGITAYDGEKRSQGKTGWVEIWDPTTMDIADAPTLVAGRGYTVYGVPSEIIDGKRRNYCYLNFPLSIDLTSGELPDADSKTVSVTHYGMTDGTLDAGIAPNNAGWNLIGNPYLANFADDDEEGFGNGVIGELQKNGSDEYEWVGSARYVVIPANNGQSYHAEMVTGTTLPSFKNFFIQVGQGDVLTFAKDARAQNAPGRMLETPKEIMLGVRLEGNGTNDRMALLLGDNFTDEYEINADLDKWSTTSQMTVAATVGKYSLAVAAITTKRSEQPVDLAVKIIKDGSYTFSLAEEWTRRRTAVSHLYLYDKETDTYTDLLNDTYTVTLASGKHNNRFSLITERNTLPTGTDILSEDGITVSRSADGLSISGLGGDAYVTVYSMTGTCLYSAKATGDIYVPLGHGIYIVRVIKDNQTAIYKTEL